MQIALSETDRSLVAAFESCELQRFSHADHVHVAWIYLGDLGWPTAATQFETSLKRFATSLGAEDKYHATITWAFLLATQERMIQLPRHHTWQAFAAANEDLLSEGVAYLYRYYDAETLHSSQAKATFLLPVRQAA